MKTARFLLPVISLLFFSLFIQAQELDDPLESSEYYQVQYFKFVPDNAVKAKKIIKEYFRTANNLAGVPNPVMEFDITSDDYNYMVVWKVTNGEDNLNWQTCPNNDNWYKAFVTVAGGEEKAKGIILKYDSYISSSKTEFAKKL
jgi:hypothetical protein